MKKILIINPGASSTKIGVYEDHHPILLKNISHSPEQIDAFRHVNDQCDFRQQVVTDTLIQEGVPMTFDAIVSRGGLGKPIPGGTYAINEQMIDDNLHAVHHHVCNIACKIAYNMAAAIPSCLALTADPGVTDELTDEARLTGLPELERSCQWHALNHKAVARRHARERGQRYEDLNLIVCHLGSGISIAAHHHGRAIDVNNALDGEGAFSNERTGSLPSADLVRLCFSGKYTERQLLSFITGKGGMQAHLGTNDMREVSRRVAAGDTHAQLVVKAMVFNIAKCICAEAAVLRGQVDAILLTGGMAHDRRLTEMITERTDFLAPVYCYPGEDEMTALADMALAVLNGEMEAKEYK